MNYEKNTNDQEAIENLGNAIIEEIAQIRKQLHSRRIQYGKATKKAQREQTAKRLLNNVDFNERF